MVSGKGLKLAIPRSIISNRTVDQQDSVSLAALDVVQCSAIDRNLCKLNGACVDRGPRLVR